MYAVYTVVKYSADTISGSDVKTLLSKKVFNCVVFTIDKQEAGNIINAAHKVNRSATYNVCVG